MEALCRALYEGTDAAERTKAHQVRRIRTERVSSSECLKTLRKASWVCFVLLGAQHSPDCV